MVLTWKKYFKITPLCAFDPQYGEVHHRQSKEICKEQNCEANNSNCGHYENASCVSSEHLILRSSKV